MVHVGHAWTWCGDLQDCFNSISEQQLKGKLPKELLAEVLVNGSPLQGLPTSPSVANLALATLDTAILRWAEKKAKQLVYTRYADDLVISGDDFDVLEAVKAMVPQIVRRCGWRLAPHKTRVQLASAGVRHVVGVGVDEQGIRPTRKAKRRLRAAIHQEGLGIDGAADRAAGLAEWCRLRTPRERKQSALGGDIPPDDELRAVQRAWMLPKAKSDRWPDKPETWLGPAIVITGDPVMMLGMSTWTTGWKSCMRQPNGQYRRGVVAWAALKGTRLAALLSDKTMTVAGVTRRRMRARCLVHQLRGHEEQLIFDRIYGDAGSVRELQAALGAAGCISVVEARATIEAGTRVLGNVPGRYAPYCDRLTKSKVSHKGRKVWVFAL